MLWKGRLSEKNDNLKYESSTKKRRGRFLLVWPPSFQNKTEQKGQPEKDSSLWCHSTLFVLLIWSKNIIVPFTACLPSYSLPQCSGRSLMVCDYVVASSSFIFFDMMEQAMWAWAWVKIKWQVFLVYQPTRPLHAVHVYPFLHSMPCPVARG